MPCECLRSGQSISQSVRVYLEWPKWHCHCKVRSTAGVNVNNESQATIGRIDFVSAFSLAATRRR